MRKKEKIKWEKGSFLAELEKSWDEEDRKRNKERNREFWRNVGMHTGIVLAMLGVGWLVLGHPDSFWVAFFIGVFVGVMWTFLGISIYRSNKGARGQGKD